MAPAPERIRKLFSAKCWVVLFIFASLAWMQTARAGLQFDVFPGYDGIVPEANWFPVVCEVRNDGPSFNAFFEISSGQFNQSQVRRVPLELPTNTRKRVVVPVFCSSRYASWDFRLIDEHNKIQAEQVNVRPRRTVAWEIPMIGALSETVSGVPSLPKIKSSQAELQPVIARLQPALFPDNPIALEGLDVLYVNSQTALELSAAQREALLAWMNGGGHLILSVEQINDIAANAWLAELLPCELVTTKLIQPGAEFLNWLRRGEIEQLELPTNSPRGKTNSNANPFLELLADSGFQQAQILAFAGTQRDGVTLVESQGIPLVVEVQRGRGKITQLNFSAEREPFLSWKNRPWFWTKLAGISPTLYQTSDYNRYGGVSVDGIFGALLDSKQIRKLPFGWLFLLLVAYLLVIGPLDQQWLKKRNRQMLTWITFPFYVLFFSFLIYFIGFKLRAGDSEFNELQIVDIFPRQENAVLRGRSFASIYSPVNQRYPLAGEQPFATLRGEFHRTYSGGEEMRGATVVQRGNHFVADVSVPVWTSQLYVGDWLQGAEDLPMQIRVVRHPESVEIFAQNNLDRKLSETRAVVNGRIYKIGDLPARQTKHLILKVDEGAPVKQFAQQNGREFFEAAQFRRRSFGNRKIEMAPALSAMAASFCSALDETQNGNAYFISPQGFDLSQYAEQGNTILLAWDSDHLLGEPLNRFSPRRNHRNTLLRLVVPKESSLGS